MRTANPALGDKIFQGLDVGSREDAMTIQGAANKTIILLFILLVPAAFVWREFFRLGIDRFPFYVYLGGGFIGGLVFAIITIFKKKWAPYTAPVYAACEGVALGALSALFEKIYPGIVMQAVGLTFGTLFMLLLAYKSRLIKATENFKLGVTAATGGIFLIYLVSFVLRLFGVNVPFIHDAGIIGIGFSAFVVVIAALNLVLDFDFIEEGEKQGAPKYMEWYAAFGLLVTLIWLYIEILRLLSKLRR